MVTGQVAGQGESDSEAAAPQAGPFRIRALRASDRGFVCTGWSRSYDESAFARLLGDHYRPTIARVINRLLVRTSVITLVACDPADEELLFGFVCFEPKASCLHYVFTRQDLRREGIATRLLAGVVIGCVSAPWRAYEWRPQAAW